MTYVVQFSEKAERDIAAAAMYIALDSPLNAERWVLGIEQAVASLADMPRRCPVAREGRQGGRELRQLVYGGYRILFTVSRRTVYIVHVRHASREEAGPGDLRT